MELLHRLSFINVNFLGISLYHKRDQNIIFIAFIGKFTRKIQLLLLYQ